MATTNKGWNYPVSTDTPDVPRDIKALADQMDAKLPYAMSAQTVNITLSAAASGTATVTWPTSRFTIAPIVTATKVGNPGAATGSIIQVNTVSSTSATITLYTATGTTASYTIAVNVIAMQFGTASASG